ncbi:hypothetical protein DFP72DRAFT_893252 [Ephemerocybe angulata]|uniref:F-box domain-containing protein n=2 Tax=Ephemerocybe angulata TaxID=980116 RepID=A0A8H6I0V6_9AGAR|nr:hypothetical protein DFP72DRAFT_893252 [Tulosesus angulatus]
MLLNIPTEVIIEVLLRLDCLDLLECRQVSRGLKDIIDHESPLQLITELSRSGLTATTDTRYKCGEMVHRLQQLRKRWQTLTWSGKQTYSVEGSCNAYELVDGLFVKTDEEGNILILELPTIQDPTFQVLAKCNLGFNPGDFALDATQDLIVFLKLEQGPGTLEHRRASLRVFSISKMQPHSDACRPIFNFDVHNDAVWGISIHRAITQIAGDVVGVFVCTGTTARLMVWNWKTGSLIGDSKDSHLSAAAYSFSFVSPTLFYVTTLADAGVIAVYSINPQEASSGFLHVASLSLPPIQDVAVINTLGCHSEPYRAKKSSKTFMTSLDKQMHVFAIVYISVTDFSHFNYRMYAPASLFLFYHALYKRRGSTSPVEARWDDWGPFRTRFLSSSSSYSWLRYVHGQRVVSPAVKNTLRVLDFNVQGLAPKCFASTNDEGPSSRMPPTALPPGNVFCEVIFSRLPYFETKKDLPTRDFDGFMIDHERIVALGVDAPETSAIGRLTVYTF